MLCVHIRRLLPWLILNILTWWYLILKYFAKILVLFFLNLLHHWFYGVMQPIDAIKSLPHKNWLDKCVLAALAERNIRRTDAKFCAKMLSPENSTESGVSGQREKGARLFSTRSIQHTGELWYQAGARRARCAYTLSERENESIVSCWQLVSFVAEIGPRRQNCR